VTDLIGKVALVTGASRGIGRAIALNFAKHGASVAIHYGNSESAARKTLHDLKAIDSVGMAEIFKSDFNAVDSIKNLCESVLNRFGRVDILVNNAGIQRSVLLHKMTNSDWNDVINVNLNAVFYLCRALLPQMLEKAVWVYT